MKKGIKEESEEDDDSDEDAETNPKKKKKMKITFDVVPLTMEDVEKLQYDEEIEEEHKESEKGKNSELRTENNRESLI